MIDTVAATVRNVTDRRGLRSFRGWKCADFLKGELSQGARNAWPTIKQISNALEQDGEARSMLRIRRGACAVATVLVLTALAISPRARAENLQDAWNIASAVNQGLRADGSQVAAEGFLLQAARAARLPTVRTFNFESFLSATPSIRNTFLGSSTGAGTTGASSGLGGTAAALGGGSGAGLAAGAASGALSASGVPATIPILGQGQRQLPVSATFATFPIYSGGRIRANIDAAAANLSASKTEVSRAVLDLRLTVAEAYVGVLRARKNLDVSRSNVERLASFAYDVRNRNEQGLAIKSDLLAAEVSLANARLSEIQARTALESAWSRYNRYLCRPLTTVVPLVELTVFAADTDWSALAASAFKAGRGGTAENDPDVQNLTARAIQRRPELAGLSAQARALSSQAESTLGGVRPQVGFTLSYLFLGNNNSVPQGIGAATFVADWTITDGGQSRKRAASYRQQASAALRRRADTLADVALEVRTRWLDLRQSRLQIPVSRLAVAQAEENVNVVTDRYRQQLSTYTEVLDAENRRIQTLNNFYNAVYDENLALFRLRRAVGDL